MAKRKSKPAVEVKVEEVETEEFKPIEEPKVKRFKNNTKEGMKIKLINGKEFKWINVKQGEIVTIPEKIALANKFEEIK